VILDGLVDACGEPILSPLLRRPGVVLSSAGIAGYGAAFAVCALFPLMALPLVPVVADPLMKGRG